MPESIALVGFTSKPDGMPKSDQTPASRRAAAQLKHPHAVERPGLGKSVISPSTRWYVAQTHLHAEATAFQHLCRRGFDVYPVRCSYRRTSSSRSVPSG